MTNGSAGPRWKGLLQNLALSAATVVVFLASAELLSRLLERGKAETPPVAPYITDWALWQGDFYTVDTTAVGWPPFEDYNQDGLRDRHHAIDRAPGVRRLVFLGDSTTVGYRVRPHQSYPSVVQDRLDGLGQRVEVLNVALGGWSTRQERIAYERIARKYRPDLVLLGVCLNDIPELGNNLGRPPRWLRGLARHSALVRLLAMAQHREIRSIEELLDQPDSPTVKAAYRRFFDEVGALRDLVHGDGARFGILVFPFELQIEPGAPAPSAQRAIAAFCQAESIPLLDLLTAVKEAGSAAYVDYDHFSPLGSDVIADELLASGLLAPVMDAPETPSSPVSTSGRLAVAAPKVASESSGTAPALLAAVADDDPKRRLDAVRALSQRSSEAATIAPLIATRLTDRNARVRAAAVWALGRIGPRAERDVPPLTRCLQDAESAVRAGAAWALGRVGAGASASGPALARALNDPDPDVRRRAIEAFPQVKPDGPACLSTLIAIIQDPQAPGRIEAVRAIGTMGPAAAPATAGLSSCLGQGDSELRRFAVDALGAIGPGAAASVSALLTAFEDPALRWRVPDALGSMGSAAGAAVPNLTVALREGNGTVRWRSARALGRIGSVAVTAGPDLARLTSDPQDNVRAAAAVALGGVGCRSEVCLGALVSAASDRASNVRRDAVTSLGRLGSSAGVSALVGAVRDDDMWVRAAAVRALGAAGRGSTKARDALSVALRDEEPMVREEAKRALQRTQE